MKTDYIPIHFEDTAMTRSILKTISFLGKGCAEDRAIEAAAQQCGLEPERVRLVWEGLSKAPRFDFLKQQQPGIEALTI